MKGFFTYPPHNIAGIGSAPELIPIFTDQWSVAITLLPLANHIRSLYNPFCLKNGAAATKAFKFKIVITITP
jgi:hypothetical protein